MTSPQVTFGFPDPDVIVIAGDWHGSTRSATRGIELAERVGAPAIIQLGDFGLWPGTDGTKYLIELENAASAAGVLIAWVDGNHEDFTQLADTPVSDDGLQHQSPHVARIPRGARWTWHGTRFAALGGATSLDRPHRTLGTSWWIEEAIKDTDLSTLAAGGPCDVLLTHDCPTGVPIPGIHHRDYGAAARSGWTLPELERAWGHRDRVAEAVAATTPTHLWHGHYHQRYSQTVALHENGPTFVEGLGDDGTGPAHNLAVVRLWPASLQVVHPIKATAQSRAHDT